MIYLDITLVTHELVLDARGGRDDRYGLYGIYKTSKKTRRNE